MSRSCELPSLSPRSPPPRLPTAAARSAISASDSCGGGAAATSKSAWTVGLTRPHHASGLPTRVEEPAALARAAQSALGELGVPARRPTTRLPTERRPPALLSSQPTQSGPPCRLSSCGASRRSTQSRMCARPARRVPRCGSRGSPGAASAAARPACAGTASASARHRAPTRRATARAPSHRTPRPRPLSGWPRRCSCGAAPPRAAGALAWAGLAGRRAAAARPRATGLRAPAAARR
eukprot:scaffold40015_cov30-Phaeocystis_antarctica.AAC.1